MPLYVYEAKDTSKGCAKCRASFEVSQHLDEKPLATCPACGAPVQRIIQSVGLTHSRTDLNYRAKRAGFHTLKRVGKGEYEKIY